MKRTLLVFAFIAVAQAAYADVSNFRHPSGIVTNPALGQVIVDTGAMTGPTTRWWSVFCCASVAAVFRIEHRNAANDADATPLQVLPVPASSCNRYDMVQWAAAEMADNERVRVTMNAAVTGAVSCTLFHSIP